MTDRLAGRVCVVTGATGTLGRAVVAEFAKEGAQLVLAARDQAKVDALQNELRSYAPHANVDVEIFDLSLMSSVRHAGVAIAKRYPRVHVLVNNAAVYRHSRVLTPEGRELMFATNHLGPFLLTNLLLPSLRAGAPSRVITVSAPSNTRVNLEDPFGEKGFKPVNAFYQSKAANIQFGSELARRLAGSGVTSNVIHPGLLKSDLIRETPAALRVPLGWFSKPPAKAAEAVLHLATHPNLEKVSGKFFIRTRETAPPKESRDLALQEELWRRSEEWTGIKRKDPVRAIAVG